MSDMNCVWSPKAEARLVFEEPAWNQLNISKAVMKSVWGQREAVSKARAGTEGKGNND